MGSELEGLESLGGFGAQPSLHSFHISQDPDMKEKIELVLCYNVVGLFCQAIWPSV